MVSEKVIIVLIITAILLSVVSIAITLSAVNTKMIPAIQPNKGGSTEDRVGGKVNLVISPWIPPNSSNSSGK
jgi:hypothetical protein